MLIPNYLIGNMTYSRDVMVVSKIALYCDDQSSTSAKVYCVKYGLKTMKKGKRKEAGVCPCYYFSLTLICPTADCPVIFINLS